MKKNFIMLLLLLSIFICFNTLIFGLETWSKEECDEKFPDNTGDLYSGPNGCGSGDMSHDMANLVGGDIFIEACNTHDKCYTSLGVKKSVCDNHFYYDMKYICINKYAFEYGKYYGCLFMADLFYTAVYIGGGSAYKSSQEQQKEYEEHNCHSY